MEKEKCTYCGELFDTEDLGYPIKGSQYLSCPSCRKELENEEEQCEEDDK